MEGFKHNEKRLGDRILFALELALKQQDLELSELLSRGLEMSMTRHSGGGEFVERREYPKDIERALDNLRHLQEKR